MRIQLGFLLLIAGLAACKEKECERSAECGARQQCVENVCQDLGTPPPVRPNPDAAVFPDARIDTGVDGGDDGGGDGGDDGGSDGGDDGGADGGDGGGMDAADGGGGGNVALGSVWVMETNGPQGLDQRAEARFDRFMAQPITQTFNAPNVMCTLTDWRQISASSAPIDGQSLTITGFNALQLPANPVVLDRVGPGRFDSGQIGAIYIFRDTGVTLTYRVQNGGNNQLGAAVGTGPGVTDFSITTPTISPVPLGQPLMVTWPAAGFNPRRNIVVELSDANRDVVLRCTNPDTGTMDVPNAARTAFLAIATDPLSFEARHEEVGSMMVPINGGGTVQTELRASKGIRRPATR